MKHIIILENSPRYFQLLVDNFPTTPIDLKWHIFIDTRPTNNFKSPDVTIVRSDSTNSIREILNTSNHPNFRVDNVILYDGWKVLFETQPAGLTNQQVEFWQLYSMSMKFACQTYLFKILGIDQFLYLDDDVLIPRDPLPLFELGAFIQKMAFFGHVGNGKYYDEIQSIAGIKVDPVKYNKNSSCAGVMLMNRQINEALQLSIDRFYRSKFLMELYDYYKAKTTPVPYSRLFFAEQVLMNILYTGLNYISKPTEASFMCGKRTILTPKTQKPVLIKKIPTLIHYAAGPHKHMWVDYFNSESWKISKKEANL